MKTKKIYQLCINKFLKFKKTEKVQYFIIVINQSQNQQISTKIQSLQEYKLSKSVDPEKISYLQNKWQFMDDQTYQSLKQVCFGGIPSDLRMDIYYCLSNLQSVKKDIQKQFYQKYENQVSLHSLYKKIKELSIKECQLLQTVKNEFDHYFSCETQKDYHQCIMYNVLKTYITICLNFTINSFHLQYNHYILAVLDKFAQLLYSMYGDEDEKNQKIEKYEEQLFWMIISFQSHVNQNLLDIKKNINKNFSIDYNLLKQAQQIRQAIKTHLPEIYTKMLCFGVSLENLFIEDIANYFANYLNTEIFFRILDLAYIKKVSSFSILLSLLQLSQKYILESNNYKEFMNALKFSLKYQFDGDTLIKTIIQINDNYSVQNIQNPLQTSEQQEAIIELIQNNVSGIVQLCDIPLLIGTTQIFQENPVKRQQSIDIDDTDLLDYRNIYIQMSDKFDLRQTESFKLYIHKLRLYWPDDCEYSFEILSGDQTALQMDIFGVNELNLQILLSIPFYQDTYVRFNVYVYLENHLKKLIKQGFINLNNFYKNMVYRHDITLKDCFQNSNIQENYYQSDVTISILIETQQEKKIFSHYHNKNQMIGPAKQISNLYEVILQSQLDKLNAKVFDAVQSTEDLLKFISDNGNKIDHIRFASILIPTNYWKLGKYYKLDSILTLQAFQCLVEDSKIFFNYSDLKKIHQAFSQNRVFYYKDFLIILILNTQGNIKQKLNVLFNIMHNFENQKDLKKCISIELAKNILFQICQIFNLPILKHEIENSIDFTLFKNTNHILKAKFYKEKQKLDLTNICKIFYQVQNLSQFNHINYGTFDILLGSNDQLNFLQRQIQFTFSQKEINQIFSIDNSAEIQIKFIQNGELKLLHYHINSNFQILERVQNQSDEQQNDENIQTIFKSTEQIINLKKYDTMISFTQFYDIFRSLPLLNNLIQKNEYLDNSFIQRQMECKFKLQVNEQPIMEVNFKSKYHQDTIVISLIQFKLTDFKKALYDLQQQKCKKREVSNKIFETNIDDLDVFETMTIVIKRIALHLIQEQLKNEISNKIKDINFENYQIHMDNDLTPVDINILSLNDLQYITQKFYKKIQIIINFGTNFTQPKLTIYDCKGIFRYQQENHDWKPCRIIAYENSKKQKKLKFYHVQFQGIESKIIQLDTFKLKPFEIQMLGDFDISQLQCIQ